ncbi:DUF6192 family protein [Streptomyces sp. NPDC018059]|uniref:DUF6192 family protein n=1 Tax=Streptomyces sp. NPDC018059 TaxID=3365041 RepID=UPI0037A9A2A9
MMSVWSGARRRTGATPPTGGPRAGARRGVSFTVHRILASVTDENERWAAIGRRRSIRDRSQAMDA